MENTDQILKQILFKHFDLNEHEIYLFGSRATNTQTQFSDYNIGILNLAGGPVSISKKQMVEEEIEASTIAYIVEIVDLNSIDQEYKAHVLTTGIKWSN